MEHLEQMEYMLLLQSLAERADGLARVFEERAVELDMEPLMQGLDSGKALSTEEKQRVFQLVEVLGELADTLRDRRTLLYAVSILQEPLDADEDPAWRDGPLLHVAQLRLMMEQAPATVVDHVEELLTACEAEMLDAHASFTQLACELESILA